MRLPLSLAEGVKNHDEPNDSCDVSRLGNSESSAENELKTAKEQQFTTVTMKNKDHIRNGLMEQKAVKTEASEEREKQTYDMNQKEDVRKADGKQEV